MTKFKETKSKKACLSCPFRRVNTNEKPNPGGSHPFVYLGQARGPFWLPCHADKNYEGKGSNVETVTQCRGAAIFRTNINNPYTLPKQLLKLEEDKENVFASEAEFAQHYLGGSIEYWERALTSQTLDLLLHNELNKQSDTRRYMSCSKE